MLVECVSVLDYVQSISQYSLPEISVNSSSREFLISLAQSKSGFCSLASKVLITEEIFCPERKQAEDRRGVAKEINDRLSLKP